MEQLIHTRDLLNSSLHRSRQIDFEIHKSCANFSRINDAFPFLEAAVRNMACKCATFGIREPVDRALAPLSGVFRVYKVVDELGGLVMVSSPDHLNLNLYLSLLKRFRQALRLLTDTCRLAILWVEDVKQFLLHRTTAAHYHSNVCKTLCLLQQLHATEERCQGSVAIAHRHLEDVFRNLLARNSLPLQLPSSLFSSGDDESEVDAPALPVPVVQNLKAIVAYFQSDSSCMSIYAEVRTTVVQASLQDLDLDYLEIEFDEIEAGYIDEWGRQLEFLVKHLLQLEYTLCTQVFGHCPDCFSKIALQSGIKSFIKFGNTITKGKKEAMKLFKLLDMFATLNSLRQDFNRIFGGKSCSEIQSETRDLVKKVVNGACEMFQELSAQIELQRLTDPPADGAVPRLVSFVTEYCNELLDDDYRAVLDQVLQIHCSWYNHNKGLASVHSIVTALEINLETWAKRYEDAALSYIFMMNSSCYLTKHVKGTRLGDLMGESWLKRHEGHVEYYAALYLKESWGKIPANDIAGVGDVKKRVRGFNEAFDKVCRKQSGWVLCDRDLRWETCQLILQLILPKYLILVGGGTGKYKYSAESLENIVSGMFQPKYDSSKCTSLMGKIKTVVAARFSPTTAAHNQ